MSLNVKPIESLFDIGLKNAASEIALVLQKKNGRIDWANRTLPPEVASLLFEKILWQIGGRNSKLELKLDSELVAKFISSNRPESIFLSGRHVDVGSVVRQIDADLKGVASLEIAHSILSERTSAAISRLFLDIASLKLSQCVFCSNGWEQLLQGLDKQKLCTLELSHIAFSDCEADRLVDFVKNCPRIQKVAFRYLSFVDAEARRTISQKILLSLRGNPSLQVLHYENQGDDLGVVQAMKQVIGDCAELKEVKFIVDLFSDPGVVELLPSIQSKERFSLDLTSNGLKNETKSQFMALSKDAIQIKC
ncbi:MAG: hypothetical protein JSS60_03355 [Verrucomicrobia bacterium]|nr:hypothetical protein [Verrucomicrobiota bacterium]